VIQPNVTPSFRRRCRQNALRAAATIACLGIGGCSYTGTGSTSTGNYWLVKVRDGYGNIYGYPRGERPAQTVRAAYLGATTADATQNAPAAAKRLGIAHVDSGIY
jgi:hypothetical protein